MGWPRTWMMMLSLQCKIRISLAYRKRTATDLYIKHVTICMFLMYFLYVFQMVWCWHMFVFKEPVADSYATMLALALADQNVSNVPSVTPVEGSKETLVKVSIQVMTITHIEWSKNIMQHYNIYIQNFMSSISSIVHQTLPPRTAVYTQ